MSRLFRLFFFFLSSSFHSFINYLLGYCFLVLYRNSYNPKWTWFECGYDVFVACTIV